MKIDGRGRWKRTQSYIDNVSGENHHAFGKPAHNRVGDRHIAMEEGRKFYISPTPCKSCGCVIKFVSSYGCHYCNKKKGYAKLILGELDKYPSKSTPKRRERLRNQTPPLTEDEKYVIISLYTEARRLSDSTGIPHEVDHIVPVCKGGSHHPDNLQILTKSDNRRKGGR